jgi:hypothetical protein
MNNRPLSTGVLTLRRAGAKISRRDGTDHVEAASMKEVVPS